MSTLSLLSMGMPRSRIGIPDMNAISRDDGRVVGAIAEIRDARYGGGLACPRCHDPRVIRWGSFNARQRYKCGACRRTFSDLTLTPAAYIKKVGSWLRYGECMAAGRTIRASAAAVGVNPTTAFRWRHRILAAHRLAKRDPLSGWIELGSTRFAYSRKGERNVQGPRRRGLNDEERMDHPMVTALIACDRNGGRSDDVCLSRRPSAAELHSVFEDRIRCPANVCGEHGKFGAAGGFANRIGARYFNAGLFAWTDRQARSKLVHLRTARSTVARFDLWLTRFRGVATKYLTNYLAWHWLLDRLWRLRPAVAILRWPLCADTRTSNPRRTIAPS